MQTYPSGINYKFSYVVKTRENVSEKSIFLITWLILQIRRLVQDNVTLSQSDQTLYT